MTDEEIKILQIKSFIVAKIAVAKAMAETPSFAPGGCTPDQQENINSEHRSIVVKGKDLL